MIGVFSPTRMVQCDSVGFETEMQRGLRSVGRGPFFHRLGFQPFGGISD
jgi:hypothetical protein